MTEINPQLTSTVFDLPDVTHITKKFVVDASASDKFEIVSGDLRIDPIPGIFDVAILGSVIQSISAESARLVINNVGKAIQPGGWLFIFGSAYLESSLSGLCHFTTPHPPHDGSDQHNQPGKEEHDNCCGNIPTGSTHWYGFRGSCAQR